MVSEWLICQMFFVVAERYEVTVGEPKRPDTYLSRGKNLARFAAMSLKNGPGEKMSPNAIFLM